MEFEQSKHLVEACLQRVVDTSYEATTVPLTEHLCTQLIEYDNDPMKLLAKIHSKSAKRKLSDRKVAPGSDAVLRSVLDARYCLCVLHVNMGKFYELTSDTYNLAMTCYQRALIWYPNSIEAGYLLGTCLRSRAVAVDDLDFVHFLWERALRAYQRLESNSAISDNDFTSSLSVSSAQNVVGALLSSDPSLSNITKDVLMSDNLFPCLKKAQASLVYRERETGKCLQDALILFYSQENRVQEALPLLLSKRYQWKLSQQVLTYTPDDIAPNYERLKELEARADFPFTFGYDSVLPEAFLRRMQHIFRPSSPFWSEHQYDFYSNCSRQVGYFSYLYPFRDRDATNVIEQVIDIVYQTMINQLEVEVCEEGEGGSRSKMACLEALRSEATQAEWWVHSRPHTSGHQFHFDSDETALYGGEQAQHPIASCIIYLSEGVGGPTVVTNQTLSSPNLASYGFLMQPQENRLAVFDATFLHGVVPGRGLCPQDIPQSGETNTPPRRRLSFMVGFWRKIKAKDRGPGCPGPGQPFPETLPTKMNHTYTWPDEVKEMIPFSLHEKPDQSRVVLPKRIEPIWEPVCFDNSEKDDNSARNEGIVAQYSTCFQGF